MRFLSKIFMILSIYSGPQGLTPYLMTIDAPTNALEVERNSAAIYKLTRYSITVSTTSSKYFSK